MAKITYEPGKYWGKLKAQALATSSNGNPQLVLTFDVLGKIDPANPSGELLSCSTYERTVFRTLTAKTVEYFWKDVDTLCEAKGLEQRPMLPSELTSEAFDCSGAELALTCEHETYNGEQKERWGLAFAGSGLDLKPLADAETAKMDALFGRGKPQAKPAPKRTTKRETVPAAANGSDDIPF